MAWYGLLMAALFIVLAACGGDSNGTFTFSPQALNITAGTTVIWKNSTSAPHTVTGNILAAEQFHPKGHLVSSLPRLVFLLITACSTLTWWYQLE